MCVHCWNTLISSRSADQVLVVAIGLLIGPLRGKINLIFYNPMPDSPLRSSSRAAVEAFQAILKNASLTATIRESRGLDIAAACGQLYAEQHTPA